MTVQDETAHLAALAEILEKVKSGGMSVDEAFDRLSPEAVRKGRGRPPGSGQKTRTLGGLQAVEFIRLTRSGYGPSVAAQMIADAHGMVASSIFHAVKRHAFTRAERSILLAQWKAVMDENLNRLELKLILIAVSLRKDSPSMVKLMEAVISAWLVEVSKEIEQVPRLGHAFARGLRGDPR